MSQPDVPVIVEILERHFEELVFLCDLCAEAVRSPYYVIGDLADLDRRIEAHMDGLLVGREATLAVIEEGLAGGEPPVVFAAAWVLLRMRTEAAAEHLWDALIQAEAEPSAGFRAALCRGPIDMIRDRLKEAVLSAPAAVAVVAAEALAAQHRLDPKTDRLSDWFENENSEVRRAAWRIAALLDSHSRV
jgi:hypothetical protein